MVGKLLDTNAVIALHKSDPAMLEFLRRNEVIIPTIVIGELYYGAYKSGKRADNLSVIDELVDSNTILDCDKVTAKYYGEIRYELKVKGRPIPPNDVWIAALARQYGLTVVTRDAHFSQVDGLTVETW